MINTERSSLLLTDDNKFIVLFKLFKYIRVINNTIKLLAIQDIKKYLNTLSKLSKFNLLFKNKDEINEKL